MKEVGECIIQLLVVRPVLGELVLLGLNKFLYERLERLIIAGPRERCPRNTVSP